MSNADLARATGMQPPNIARLERAGSLETARVETLRRYLDALGFELRLVAVSKSGAPVEIVEATDNE
jgi:hypothetical protein